MNLRPLGDRVILKQDEGVSVTKGGIHIPDNAKEKSISGEVLAVGPGKLNDKGDLIPMNVKVGEKVCYERYGGTEIEVDNEKFVALKESDILAVFVN